VLASSPGIYKPLGIFLGAVQTPGEKRAQSLINTGRGKKRPAPPHSSDEEEEEEDSEEDGVVNQGDLWGSEDSDADMVDDYGADSRSEDEDAGEKVRVTSWGIHK
jgi:ribosomal RNA methyltransferase Nop2